jgi:hypothetical protein
VNHWNCQRWYHVPSLLIDYLRVYIRSRIFHLYGDVTIAGEGLQNLGLCSALRGLGLWAGRDLYRATPAVTWGLCFSGLIRRTDPFNRLLRHARGCGGTILTLILTGMCLYFHVLVNKQCEIKDWERSKSCNSFHCAATEGWKKILGNTVSAITSHCSRLEHHWKDILFMHESKCASGASKLVSYEFYNNPWVAAFADGL